MGPKNTLSPAPPLPIVTGHVFHPLCGAFCAIPGGHFLCVYPDGETMCARPGMEHENQGPHAEFLLCERDDYERAEARKYRT